MAADCESVSQCTPGGAAEILVRRLVRVSGIVQGVGFRPLVYGLATRLGLTGFVLNRTGEVVIEIEGRPDLLDRFVSELTDRPPVLAKIDRITCESIPVRGDAEFVIRTSEAGAGSEVFVSPDVAPCDDCLAEFREPADRRYRYPFLNCTNCGPRLTIVTGAPYDRSRTTMAGFPMCPACRAEYDNPADRRFHAQPTACADCGPRLQLLDAAGRAVETDDPVRSFTVALLAGRIGALKGLGGYHLACDARSEPAVAELRRRKHRDEKPFAVMVVDAAKAGAICEIGPRELELLTLPRRPIVLLQKRGGGNVADAVAPGNPYLGVMLPYTPVHDLLLRELNGVPLVMTSGNRSDEPIAYEDEDAVARLTGIADLFLVHDRPIHVRCDDSVTRIVGRRELPLRRSRGYAPQPVALPFECPRPILAVGGQLKATFALGRGRHAFISHHLGDLDQFDAYKAFERDIGLYEQLFGMRPEIIAHDLHPDYASTGYARRREPSPARLVAVQHHHAHMATCMAENGLTEPVIGVTFDGTGYGADGAIWGGEFLVGEYKDFRRSAHLRYVGLPGGDAAVREPWRMAVAYLKDAGGENRALQARHRPHEYRAVETMLERRFRCPPTSSAGRLFDAVAALAGVRDEVSYEGQAAVELEWLSTGIAPDGVYPFEINRESEASPWIIDTRPLIRAVNADAAVGTAAAIIGRRFHSTLVEIIAAVCAPLRGETGLSAVVLSGGVFLNALLTREVEERLTADGFRVYRHRLVPPNDGGLSLGQVAVAAARSQDAP
jgi:hydrogenase maturation protein HypF